MRFTKMQGLGNDYLYVYGEAPADVAPLCVKLSDRHLGAGADGMIFISPSASADFRMRIFNADGSEAAMCGNGIRCVGKYVYDKGYTDKTQLRIETNSGLRTLRLHVLGDRVRSVTVDMGTAEVGGEKELSVDGQTVRVTPVSVGNPHAVLFTEDAEAAPLTTLGPRIEHHPAFPGGVNLKDSWCSIDKGELFVRGMHISPYEKGNIFNRDPMRVRRLLMHKREINKLYGTLKQEGLSLIPLSLYIKDSRVKMQLGLCKGKKLYDKRADIAKRDANREIDRNIKTRNQ